MKKYLSWKLFAILAFTVVLGFFDLPSNVQTKVLPFTPDSIQKSKIHLGLDLQGGSQLDYKIDLRKVAPADQKGIVEGVQEVINNRVNRLGVAEPNIYRSDVAGETHIIVELAETATLAQEDVDQYLGQNKILANLTDDEKKHVSLEKAKDTVGKTIQLEFKELKADPTKVDPQEKEKTQKQGQDALDKIKNGASFSVVGQEEKQAYPEKVKYDKVDYTFESKLKEDVKAAIEGLKNGDTTKKLVDTKGDFNIDQATGQAVQDTGLSIIKLVDVKEDVKSKKEVDASHILVSYKGAQGADASITRDADAAYKLAKEIKAKLDNNGDFAALAKQYSDDKSNKDTAGKLTKAVNGDGSYVAEFEKGALDLTKTGAISDPVKTQFGYHIIKADAIRSDIKEKEYKYEIISYSTKADPWQDTGLTGEHFLHADVQIDQVFQPFVSIQFNDKGAKLFEEITGRNVGKPVAIFVGGELISHPNVNEKISGGKAQISGTFTSEEANTLARNLNTGAIPAPIVLTGEYTLGATLGQDALNKSLWAGLIGIILVIIFMVVLYRLPGVIASVALLIYGVLFVFLIKAQLNLALSLLISLAIFGFLVAKIVNSKEPGWEKFLSFMISCFAFFFLTFLLKSGVVVTLAGLAGIVMSFGIAVDANILIFERLKEELHEGKSLSTAVESAFARAWSAIRDSNFSTLITCAILFFFGSSIIRGFAFNLALGILVSMFTAITVTKTLLQWFIGKKIAENLKLFGFSGKKHGNFGFIKKSKIWFAFSGTLVVISIIAIATFGLNLGIDFKGGTLLEFKFNEKIDRATLTTKLQGLEASVNKDIDANPTSSNSVLINPKTPALSSAPNTEAKLDFRALNIIESGDNDFIIKTNYIGAVAHDKLIAQMKTTFPGFTEQRFTSIGPVVGANLMNKAIIAIVVALLMIVAYLAFAFRKVPKGVSTWRFGASAGIVAIVHDVIITTGLFAILGHFFNVEIDALFITAMLTVFGYSVNDTIVVFDRLREKLIHNPGASLEDTANQALNETVVRSFNTSFTAILSLLSILFFGSGAIFYFVLALTFGIGIGTYSSIFTATPMLVLWSKMADKKGKK